MVVDYEEFKDYKEQPFKWKFWASYIRKRTKKDEAILEIGCTHGYLFSYLKDYTNKYGIDISSSAIEHAKEINPDVQFTVMNAETLSFPENTFQLVVCIDTIEHVKNPEACIKEVSRVLKQNGTLIIVTPNPESLSGKKKGLKWFAFQDPTHVSIHTAKEWQELLEKNNLIAAKKTTIDLFDFPYFNTICKGLNLFLYTIKLPFLSKYGDNTVLVTRKK